MKIMYSIALLFVLISYPSSSAAGSSCNEVPDALMDYGIYSIVHKQFAINEIPTVSISGISLTNGRISGVDTLMRTCHVTAMKDSNGRINLQACAGVKELKVSFVIKFFLSKWITGEFLQAYISGTKIKIGVSVLPKSGESPKMDLFQVQDLGIIKVRFHGPGSILNKLLNWFLTTSLRNKIKSAIENNVADALNKQLIQVKLP